MNNLRHSLSSSTYISNAIKESQHKQRQGHSTTVQTPKRTQKNIFVLEAIFISRVIMDRQPLQRRKTVAITMPEFQNYLAWKTGYFHPHECASKPFPIEILIKGKLYHYIGKFKTFLRRLGPKFKVPRVKGVKRQA